MRDAAVRRSGGPGVRLRTLGADEPRARWPRCWRSTGNAVERGMSHGMTSSRASRSAATRPTPSPSAPACSTTSPALARSPARPPGLHRQRQPRRAAVPERIAALRARRASRRCSCAMVMPAGEQEKTARALRRADARRWPHCGASRDATVIALGGGVVGDLAGFAAACWMRGVRLRAAADDAAGDGRFLGRRQDRGRPAAGQEPGRRLPPAARRVRRHHRCCARCPTRELRAGLAEVVKYGAIADAPFFAWLEANAEALLAARRRGARPRRSPRSVAYKAGVVARDEHEHGERMLLNFGHTFGHAIEAEQGYGGLLTRRGGGGGHGAGGAAVDALGLRAGRGRATAGRPCCRASACRRPIPAGLDAQALLARMRLDKKARSGGLRLVLWRGAGRRASCRRRARGRVRAVLSRRAA